MYFLFCRSAPITIYKRGLKTLKIEVSHLKRSSNKLSLSSLARSIHQTYIKDFYVLCTELSFFVVVVVFLKHTHTHIEREKKKEGELNYARIYSSSHKKHTHREIMKPLSFYIS